MTTAQQYNLSNALPIEVVGHVRIANDLGEVLLDEQNSVHPQNLARVFARALANEHNYHIHRIAFGNGGTVIDAAHQITYKTTNDGQVPDTAEWKSTLYNETYSEIVDESNIMIGSGPGSSPVNDPLSTAGSGPGVRSEEAGLISKVHVQVVLNPFEPTGQTSTDVLFPQESIEDAFVFDELGLYTSGISHNQTAGYQVIDVGTKFDSDLTGLALNNEYAFSFAIDNGTTQTITFNTGPVGSGPGGQLTFGDLVSILNSTLTNCIVQISTTSGSTNTFGRLTFTSRTSGTGSSVSIVVPGTLPNNWLFSNLSGFVSVMPPVNGQNAGSKNDPISPTQEGERLLTHLIFSPIRKSANRTITVTYTLTIQVARSSYS